MKLRSNTWSLFLKPTPSKVGMDTLAPRVSGRLPTNLKALRETVSYFCLPQTPAFPICSLPHCWMGHTLRQGAGATGHWESVGIPRRDCESNTEEVITSVPLLHVTLLYGSPALFHPYSHKKEANKSFPVCKVCFEREDGERVFR